MNKLNKTQEESPVRVKHVRYRNMDEMTPYQRWRILLALIQIVATLGVPFVVIALNEYLRAN
jgi:hypothetical protein